MLRAIFLASPFVLSAVISCADGSPVFDDSRLNAGSGGTDAAQSGSAAGGTTSNQAGSNAAAGKGNNTAGKGNGGNGNNAGNANGAGNGNNGGSTNGGTSPIDGGASNAGAPTDPMAGAPGAAGDTGVAGAPNVPQCPNVFGAYDVANTEGNCDGVGKNAPQMIQGTDVACFAHFVSIPVVGNAAVNGGAALDENGDFNGVMLSFGDTQRSPCMGTWNQGNQRMTVRCGGQGDACTVVLDRK